MKEKYIVVADTYGCYGCCITVFGIFDTEQEAINYIVANPIPEIPAECAGLWQDEAMKEKHYFDFFRYSNNAPRKEWAKNYIRKFDGTPLLIGEYRE